jgi:hypothetical protein
MCNRSRRSAAERVISGIGGALAVKAVTPALQPTVKFGGGFRLEIGTASCWNVCATRVAEALRPI